MLLLLTGPTGTGKTTILRILRDRYSFAIVPTFTDRPERRAEFDAGKIALSAIELDDMIRSDTCDVHLYRGNRYVNRKGELMRHASDPGSRSVCDYVGDYPIELTSFGRYASGVVLVPTTAVRLTWQLLRAGRSDRIASAWRNLAAIRGQAFWPSGWRVITQSSADETAFQITRYIEDESRERYGGE